MNRRHLTFAVALVIAVASPVRAAALFEYGPRPPQSVFDPGGFLDPANLRKISDPLAAVYKTEGVDVIVVVLADLGNAPPEHVASRFAEAWCTAPLHCVVLSVPGHAESPWIIPGGRLFGQLVPEQVRQAVDAARRRAASEPKPAAQVAAAATEAADLLRYWMANAINRSENIRTESGRMRQELRNKGDRLRILLLAAAAAVIPLVVGLSLLIVRLRNRGPRSFPKQPWKPRLGAPYAGGNHAVVDLGAPAP